MKSFNYKINTNGTVTAIEMKANTTTKQIGYALIRKRIIETTGIKSSGKA